MAPAFSTAHTVTSTTQRIQSRGRSPRTICTGAPTFSVDRGRAGVEARPYGEWLRGLTGNVIALHPRCTNPSVTALRAATAPLSGEPRGGRKLAAFTHLFTAMMTPAFRTHRRGRRPRRPLRWIIAGAGMDVPVRPDRQRPRHPRCARLASTAPRIQSRGHSPCTIFTGAPTLSVIPRREGVEALPYGGLGGARISPTLPSTPQSRRFAP